MIFNWLIGIICFILFVVFLFIWNEIQTEYRCEYITAVEVEHVGAGYIQLLVGIDRYVYPNLVECIFNERKWTKKTDRYVKRLTMDGNTFMFTDMKNVPKEEDTSLHTLVLRICHERSMNNIRDFDGKIQWVPANSNSEADIKKGLPSFGLQNIYNI